MSFNWFIKVVQLALKDPSQEIVRVKLGRVFPHSHSAFLHSLLVVIGLLLYSWLPDWLHITNHNAGK